MLGYPWWIRKINRSFLQLFACPIPEGQPSVAQVSPVRSEGRSPAPWPLGAPRHHRHQRGVRSKSAGSQGLQGSGIINETVHKRPQFFKKKWKNGDFTKSTGILAACVLLSNKYNGYLSRKTGDTYQNNDDLRFLRTYILRSQMILPNRPPCAKNRDGTRWNQQTCCGHERRNS